LNCKYISIRFIKYSNIQCTRNRLSNCSNAFKIERYSVRVYFYRITTRSAFFYSNFIT